MSRLTILLAFNLTVVAACDEPTPEPKVIQLEPAPEPVAPAKVAKHDPELWKEPERTPEPPPADEAWEYLSGADEMTGKITSMATIPSKEEYELPFPYQGGTHARLTLRHHPRQGTDVMLTINKGQLQCFAFTGCKVLVRFDDAEPSTFKASGPEDASNDTLFINGSKKFIAALKKTKRVKIELPFFQHGTRLFTFKTEDLTWDH